MLIACIVLVHPPNSLSWPLFLSFLAIASLCVRGTRREPRPQNQHPHFVKYQSRSLYVERRGDYRGGGITIASVSVCVCVCVCVSERMQLARGIHK